MSWHTLQDVDESFFETAPQIHRFTVDVAVPPERVWRSLVSEESVAAWGPLVKALRWTTPRPFGVGTTRNVTLPLGIITVRERFFRWDEGTRYSFGAYEANRPMLRRFGEDYLVEPHGSGGTRFTWTIAIEGEPRFRSLVALSGPLNKLAFGQAARGAKAYFAKNP